MFDAWFAEHETEVAAWLHDLHAHPELGFEEHRTSGFVARQLRQAGLDVETGVGRTGVVGILRRGPASRRQKQRTIGFRAELDALPILEQADVAYRSKIAGKSHACGHDGHTATLLAAATYLAQQGDFEGTAVFIFQPAEELLTGARAMLEDGLLKRYPLDEIYAMHNIPGLPAGHIAVPSGGALASSDEVIVTIHATGTHGSAPHTGADGVMAAAAFLTTLQQCVTRVIDARDSGVISFGRIAGGTAGNVLPDRVEIAGSMRTHAAEVRKRLVGQLTQVARSVEMSFGVRVEVNVVPKVPVTMNHPDCVEAVLSSSARVLGASRIIRSPRPVMASDDFSLFLEKVPGAYFFAGQDGPYCHDPRFVFDPSLIQVGAAIYADLALSRCAAAKGPQVRPSGVAAPRSKAKKTITA
jgi:amidohydrolase